MFDFNTIVIAGVVLTVLVAVFLAFLFYFIQKHWYYSKVILPRTKNWVFLEIQMPKDNSEDKQQGQPASEEAKKQLIAVAEQLFTSLSEISSHNWFFQPKDYLSFEIACTEKKISFYINCPRHLQELVEKQLLAQYPHAFIETVRGYNPFQTGGQVVAAELKPNKPYMFPIRTYKNMETDPLNAITNAMSKLGEDEGVAIQFILSPAGHRWQDKPRHMALEIQQGKNPSAVMGSQSAKFLEATMGAVRDRAIGKSEKDPNSHRSDLSGIYSPIQLTPMQQELVKKFEEKASRPGFRTNIRIVASSKTPGAAAVNLNNIVSSFLQYNIPPFNGFKIKKRKTPAIVKDYIFRIYRRYGRKAIFNTEELASLWHLPTPLFGNAEYQMAAKQKSAAAN
jgi:hypothetical protein